MFDIFKRWKVMVENETGIRVKKLQSENGGEYENSEFKKFCYKNGIKLEKTVSGTPLQNGEVKQMNRTLIERARNIRI